MGEYDDKIDSQMQGEYIERLRQENETLKQQNETLLATLSRNNERLILQAQQNAQLKLTLHTAPQFANIMGELTSMRSRIDAVYAALFEAQSEE